MPRNPPKPKPQPSLRVPATLEPPLSNAALSQLTAVLQTAPGRPFSQLNALLTESLAQNDDFMRRMREFIVRATARYGDAEEPDPHTPAKEREAFARETVLREVQQAIRTGELALPDGVRDRAWRIVRDGFEATVQVDHEERELS